MQWPKLTDVPAMLGVVTSFLNVTEATKIERYLIYHLILATALVKFQLKLTFFNFHSRQ